MYSLLKMDDFLAEIQDSSGEIFDLPEMKDDDETKSFDQFLNSDTDF